MAVWGFRVSGLRPSNSGIMVLGVGVPKRTSQGLGLKGSRV